MTRWTLVCILAWSTLATAQPRSEAALPSVDGHVVMLYYEEIDRAAEFYGKRLGLEKTLDWGWVRFFRLGADAHVGLVESGRGYHRAQDTNAVMLSLISRDVDAWHARLRRFDDIEFLKLPADRGPIRSFLMRDPGGYTVEYFQWLEKPEQLED